MYDCCWKTLQFLKLVDIINFFKAWIISKWVSFVSIEVKNKKKIHESSNFVTD